MDSITIKNRSIVILKNGTKIDTYLVKVVEIKRFEDDKPTWQLELVAVNSQKDSLQMIILNEKNWNYELNNDSP